ncbi:MAG: hypothetical protein LBP61_08240 [Desulfovibrio sp.]|jgi:hypothetical protein|nr:hypothetical protein [Desulfovibrio sp.]
MSMMSKGNNPPDEWGDSPETEARVLPGLASQLRAEFDEAQKARAEHEEMWLDDLRQYRGMYNAEELERMDEGRSRIFLNTTKQRIDSVKARLMSLLFPSTSDQNWSIQPTPDPEIPEDALLAEMQRAMQEQRQPRTEEQIAKEISDRMSQVIADQLEETQRRPNYRATCGDIIHQSLLYGTGILKGPLFDSTSRSRLQRDANGGYVMAAADVTEPFPLFEMAPVWECYLDASTANPESMRYVWQTHIMNAKELLGLAAFPLFEGESIRRYVDDNPDGDLSPYSWENELRYMGVDRGTSATRGESSALLTHGRFRVYERWGQLTGRQLRDAGLEMDDLDELTTYDAQVWMLGDKIIKLAPLPVDGLGMPFHLFYFHKDETGIWGEGLAWTLRAVQQALNATVRILMDNAAITSGPFVGVNVSALAVGEKATRLYPWKVFLFDSAEDMREALMFWQMQGNTAEIIRIYELLMKTADEMSVPRYMAGDNTMLRGAGETASGLEMLMNAANLTIQDLVRNFDDGITRPFIRALYIWNMIFHPDPGIKGDFDVVATGSSSLLAKEAEGQKLLQAMSILQNPLFAGRVKEEDLLKDFLQKFNLPDHIMRTPEEYQAWQAEQLRAQAQAEAEAEVQAVAKELARQGLPPDAVAQQIMAMAAQAAAQAMPPQQQQGGVPPQDAQALPPQGGMA